MASKMLLELEKEEKALLTSKKFWKGEVGDNENSISWAERSLVTHRANLAKAKDEFGKVDKALTRIQTRIASIRANAEKDKQRERRENKLERLRAEEEELLAQDQ